MRAFLKKAGSPFYMTSQGRGVLPDDHPYAHLTIRNDAFREADLIIILCTNYVIGHALPRRLSAQVKVARIDERSLAGYCRDYAISVPSNDGIRVRRGKARQDATAAWPRV
jgi:thiamine pyrophosphate-dependent acetolactate synthase large subunit-like protein